MNHSHKEQPVLTYILKRVQDQILKAILTRNVWFLVINHTSLLMFLQLKLISLLCRYMDHSHSSHSIHNRLKGEKSKAILIEICTFYTFLYSLKIKEKSILMLMCLIQVSKSFSEVQKHLFLHQLIHNMTKDCSLNYKFST